MNRKNESVQAKPPSQQLEFAVGEMADEARQKAVESAARVISEKILEHIDKDASIRKMRRDSIAKAREVLASKRSNDKKPSANPKKATRKYKARQEKPKITTEMAVLKPSTRKKKDHGDVAPPAEVPRGSRGADV